MAGESERQIVGDDATAVIYNSDEIDTTLLDLDIDATAAGVNGVFQQLLDDTCGPLDDFSSGDFVDYQRRQLLNSRHTDFRKEELTTESQRTQRKTQRSIKIRKKGFIAQ